MAWRFALILDPAAHDDPRDDFSGTFSAVDPAVPALRVGELSAQRGDGIFETIGVIDGHAQEVKAHLERLCRSAQMCDLPEPNLAQWNQAVATAQEHCGTGEAAIKLILSRGVDGGPAPTAWVTVADAADFRRPRTDGVRTVSLDRGYDSGVPARAPWLLLGAKTLSYAVNMAAIREAKRRGVDDAVFVTTDGFVLEAPTASVILRAADSYVTPTPAGGILQGTTQASVFGWLERQGIPTAYRDVRTSELTTADAAWLVSSVRLAAPISEIDGIPIAVDRDVTARMNEYLLSPRR
jgi:4-amino-4-deoxychorismate lyase